MYTTLNKIRRHHPCEDGWEKLLRHLGKTAADDEPLSIMTVLESNGIEDTIWCLRAVDGHDRERQLFAVRCVRRFQRILSVESIKALNVAEMFSKGLVDQDRLDEARLASWDVAIEMDKMDEFEATDRPWSLKLARASLAWAVWNTTKTFVCPFSVWNASTAVARAAELLAEHAGEDWRAAFKNELKRAAFKNELKFQAQLFVDMFSQERKD